MNDDTIASTLPEKPTLELELDWEQYFRDFCEAHGKYPVLHNDLLLFPDGWRYSPDDYMGPEYSPPVSKQRLQTLQLAYWQRRYSIIRQEQQQLKQVLDDLHALQLGKSVTLSQRIVYKDDEGKSVQEAKPLDVTILKKRLKWLTNDLDNCKIKLSELGYTNGTV